jgi:hypothetical protein
MKWKKSELHFSKPIQNNKSRNIFKEKYMPGLKMMEEK